MSLLRPRPPSSASRALQCWNARADIRLTNARWVCALFVAPGIVDIDNGAVHQNPSLPQSHPPLTCPVLCYPLTRAKTPRRT